MHIKTIAKAKFKEARESYLARIRDAPSEQRNDLVQTPPYKWLPPTERAVEPAVKGTLQPLLSTRLVDKQHNTQEHHAQGSTPDPVVSKMNDALNSTSANVALALPATAASLSLSSSVLPLSLDFPSSKELPVSSVPHNASEFLHSQVTPAASASLTLPDAKLDPAVAHSEVPKSKSLPLSQHAPSSSAPSSARPNQIHNSTAPASTPVTHPDGVDLSARNLQRVNRRSTTESNPGTSASVSRTLSLSGGSVNGDTYQTVPRGHTQVRTGMFKAHKKRSEAEMLKIDHHPAYFLQDEEVSSTERIALPAKRRRKILGTWVESESDDPEDEDYANLSDGSEHGRFGQRSSRRGGLRSSSRRHNSAQSASGEGDGHYEGATPEGPQFTLASKLPKVILRLGPRPPDDELKAESHVVATGEYAPKVPDGISIVAQALWLHGGAVEMPASPAVSPMAVRPAM